MKLPFRLTQEQMELRRLAAAKDLEAGMKQAEVARKYGVSRSSVFRWNKTLHSKGLKGLRLRKAKGQERRLPLEKLKQLPGYPRIETYRLPAYCPKLEPDEWVWNYIKRRELPNLDVRDTSELAAEVTAAFKRIKRRPRLLNSFFTAAELPWIRKCYLI